MTLPRSGPPFVQTADQNVLLITIDTLRADALSCYGGPAATPAIDRLASEGTRYTFAHAHAVVTLPSHTSILTGLYPFQHGVRDNSGFRLDPSKTPLAARLQRAGFATGAFVGAFPVQAQFGLSAGFDTYDDRFGEAAAASDFSIPERPAPAVVASAQAWIDAQRSKWFAWVHVFDPHAPYRPPEPYASRYAGHPYYGEVAAADAALGVLLDRVRRASARPTLVIVTADHGEALGDHGEATHGLFAYESTLHVPLIVAQIGGGRPERQGTVSDAPVRHIDLVPTVLDAVGLPRPDALDGRSLADTSSPDTRASYFEALSAALNRGWAPITGLIAGREKLIDAPLPELYDLAHDPPERVTLIDREPARRRALTARLADLAPSLPTTRRPEDAATTERLQSLGYVTGSTPLKARYTVDDDPKRLIDIDNDVQRAVGLFEEGRLADAAALCRRIIERRPDMPLAYQQLAFLEWELGQQQQAIATLRAARQAGIDNAAIDAKLGIYLSESGRAADALPLLEHAAAVTTDTDTLNALAIGYARTGKPDRAVATFHRIIDLDPGNAMAWQNIGSVALERGDLAAARTAFERALAADPRWAAAYTGLGVVALRQGDRRGAIDRWKRAVELDPRDFNALFNVASELVADGRVEEARPFMEVFVRTAPPAAFGPEIRRFSAILASSRRPPPPASAR